MFFEEEKLVLLLVSNSKSPNFFSLVFGPFTSDFANTLSIIANTTPYFVLKNYIPAMSVFLKAYMKRTPSKIDCVGVKSLTLSRTPSVFS